jgi:hypothetical protein
MLYRAANKLIKTLYVARIAMLSGDDNKALLNYNEAASIFNEKNEQPNDKKKYFNTSLAICYNNIACIHAKQKEYFK